MTARDRTRKEQLKDLSLVEPGFNVGIGIVVDVVDVVVVVVVGSSNTDIDQRNAPVRSRIMTEKQDCGRGSFSDVGVPPTPLDVCLRQFSS